MQLSVASLPETGSVLRLLLKPFVFSRRWPRFCHDLELDEKEIGGVALTKFGDPLPDSTIKACLASQAVLLEPLAVRPSITTLANCGLKPASCGFGRSWEHSLIFVLLSFILRSPPRRLCAKKSSRDGHSHCA